VERVVKARHVALACGATVALALMALWLWNEEEAPTTPVAYVVCGYDLLGESRAYRVDLLAGELSGVSEPIAWLGQPHHLAYDPVHSRLYIASMNKKWSPPMWPVTALRARGGEFEVVNRFPTNRENGLLEKARAGEKPPKRDRLNKHYVRMREAYSVIVSPDGSELYMSYGRLSDTGMLTEVWDADTGEVLRGLPTPIRSHYSWSPDGDRLASIWPSYDPAAERDWDVADVAFSGGIGVISTQSGEKSPLRHLEDNKGMHPPWGRIDEPFVYLFPGNSHLGMVRMYDRDTGEVLSELEVRQLTGLMPDGSPEIAVLEGGRLIAVSAFERTAPVELKSPLSVAEQEQSYVVLIDVLERREITRTQVGSRCTNAVVAYE